MQDNRKLLAQASDLVLPQCDIQVLGQSASGKSMFMRGLIGLIEKRRTYQRGHTIFKAKGQATLRAPLRLADEQNSPANDI